MNQDTIQITYEAIDNPILRLMIIFLAVAVSSLTGAVVYLYRERQALQREMIDMNRESIRVYENVENALEGMSKEIAFLRDSFNRKT